MCGIAGYIVSPAAAADHDQVIEYMTGTLRHRGPDDGGVWRDEKTGVFLGHRRLSILDLSASGHQPMISASGRYVVVYNGEIYNHLEIRRTLDEEVCGHGHPTSWRGHSDTETFLAAADAWGIRRAIEACVGMFAIAVWDRAERILTLARDRLGEKPLYYGWINGGFVFGSELKALHACPGFSAPVDTDALGLYFAFGYVPAPWSIYTGIRKLTPGHILTLSAPEGPVRASLHDEPYWELKTVMRRAKFSGDDEEAVDELDRLLSRAIRLQKIADVPVGSFLSGGIDSSLVTALMQEQSADRIRTFSIGFEEKRYDESPYAEAVARHLGTDHRTLIVTPAEMLDMVPKIPRIWDEPFADSSQIPTAMVAALARQDVTVSLSGDAGDELFAGYERYSSSRRVENTPAKKFISGLISAMPLRALDRIGGVGGLDQGRMMRRRLQNLARTLKADDPVSRYLMRMSMWGDVSKIVPTATISPSDVLQCQTAPDIDYVSAITSTDMVTYLPGDILTKVDRAAMAVSLETRIPLLDHRVVEFAFSLPISMKMRDGQTKWPLRRVLERRVPSGLFDRPKKGFSVPLERWLRGPLRDWAESLLSGPSLEAAGLDPKPILQFWQEHISGRQSWGNRLWSVLMYQAWRAEYGK